MSRVKFRDMGRGRCKSGLVLVCLLLGVYAPSLAQTGILKGHVYDAETNEPLAYANIILEGTSRGTYSLADGSYEIKLDSGRHQIRYHFLSYRDTTVTVDIKSGEHTTQDISLWPDMVSMDVTVSANQAEKKVQQIALNREQRNSNLKAYRANVYKLAILSKIPDSISHEQVKPDELEPMAFSERTGSITYTASPERYVETIDANRASDNFFSEYDFFSTGGSPLNLNAEEVPLSILSEDITVAGPVASDAGRFYYLQDEPADNTWPAGTIKITVDPKTDNRPLFEGTIWYQEEQGAILGIDVKLNDYANTNTGTFKISNLRYQQSYAKVGDFWLPETTELSAVIEFLASKDPIFYHDEWSWTDYRINDRSIRNERLGLNTTQIQPDAHQKEESYWDSLSGRKHNSNVQQLESAKNYTEENVLVRTGMSAMRAFFRLPYQLEDFYLTNISDIYHYNRVEGHYLGLGLRSPVHPNYTYRLIGGYGFGNESYSYEVSGHHYPRGFFAGPEFGLYKTTVQQYQDYEYNRTPLDFFEFRQTLYALLSGTTQNNYFEREGWKAGLRFRLRPESFFRVLYLDEHHNSLSATTNFSLFGGDLEVDKFLNNDPAHPTEAGRNKGLYLHLHHDTRKYQRAQFLRDYNIREFGWLADAVWEMGLEEWDSDFDFNRYRLGLKFYWPVFSSHFFQTDIILGAADGGTPNQRLFTYNGFVVDDYVRYRPFATISYREPIVQRVSQLKLRYKFGSSVTRSIPIGFIRKSGIQISTVLTGGVVDDKATLEPLLPYSESEAQAEVGIAFSKILGIFYAEFSKKLYGNFGESYGFTIIF
ncbi:DUF5686 and carboxypeptidase-like regulatory domain-containing protein [Gracilimonas mengyeensis]|uniref:CarboxypepD_reg-like domain-containing protein n=1 Tax=Gracilimonas mengyeensis TaxID=1302730 RepID=A0A521APB9_9BACT|nr:DUF5686 and carboxypeptidase-like regulatory domain-containing protein [Gracilimonas mengyeensis]SMO36626.1 CarboxypepD_reg-like domain-containing protein [Gracilimonas mengyeensis]